MPAEVSTDCASGAHTLTPVVSASFQARRAERQQRFAADLVALQSSNAAPAARNAGSLAYSSIDGGIGDGWLRLEGGYGTNQSLEKEYLRLTAVPKAEDVRPPKVHTDRYVLLCWCWDKLLRCFSALRTCCKDSEEPLTTAALLADVVPK